MCMLCKRLLKNLPHRKLHSTFNGKGCVTFYPNKKNVSGIFREKHPSGKDV